FEILAPARNFAVGERASRRAARLGLMEDSPRVAAAIAGYWSAVPGGDDVLRRQAIAEFAIPGAGWATPWSGAFISWLACEAGVPAFRRSALHHDYVEQAVAARAGGHGPFVAHDLDEVVPAPGDLLCTARGGAEFSEVADVGSGPSRAMHCDLVVATEPSARRVYAIGGNVANAVSLTVVATDAEGRPRPQSALPGAHRWFTVLRPRMPAEGSPSLDHSPAMLELFQSWRQWASATGNPPPRGLRPAPGTAPAVAPRPAATAADRRGPPAPCPRRPAAHRPGAGRARGRGMVGVAAALHGAAAQLVGAVARRSAVLAAGTGGRGRPRFDRRHLGRGTQRGAQPRRRGHLRT